MSKWKTGVLVESRMLSPFVKALRFKVTDWEPATAGQHYMVRIESPEGYIAERYYSLANSPLEKGIIELGVQILTDGEVSTFLHALNVGEKIKLRGPFGTHFSWEPRTNSPTVLIAGGSGIIPFMSMIRLNHEHTNVNQSIPMKIIGSFRTKKDILYADELNSIVKTNPRIKLALTLTRENWNGRTGRIDREYLEKELCSDIQSEAIIYISGSTLFVESMKGYLGAIGVQSSRIKEEQFG